ncbi:DUF2214 domain-containing protein [Antarcticirhabdus aurantiaca]|uniref:DUF2214 domain-containing protein n=1 Tax=Antarcticirhabdus aurantiaca TaxID=2606717 RepID=A0ACD4NPW6_9HYPH|nr:DUF2214 domain-containing protein [Antarcticirhabdus aurantiaca]WAJ28956.1 DUF2214 domain-containing protein [Jeongeuplla avenae]
MEGFAELVAAWPGARFLRQSLVAYPLVNALHILAIALVAGPILVLDLRILGAFRAIPAAHLARPLARTAAVGVGLALVTGALLFSTRPAGYLANPAFLLKVALVGLGILNALVIRATPGWRRLLAGAEPGAPDRALALVSAATWIAAILAGRWIAFVE